MFAKELKLRNYNITAKGTKLKAFRNQQHNVVCHLFTVRLPARSVSPPANIHPFHSVH
jgi:hypothetical protein